jgi:hypothetical protein
MISVEVWTTIRTLRAQGHSISAISRQLRLSRQPPRPDRIRPPSPHLLVNDLVELSSRDRDATRGGFLARELGAHDLGGRKVDDGVIEVKEDARGCC